MRNRRLVVVGAIALALFVAACTPAGGASDGPEVTASGSVTSNGEPTQATADMFLSMVCPTRTAVNNLLATATASGGWQKMPAQDARRFAQAAVAETQTTVRKLDETTWPETVAESIPSVVDEYLATLRPLERLTQVSAQDRTAVWQELQGQSRSAEEKVRIDLGLGSFDSTENGCPLPPNVTPTKPKKDGPNPSSTTKNSAWTMHWTSPSGNIACGYAPEGRDGAPVVACMVLDEQRLMRVRANGSVEGPLIADSGDRAQLTSSNARALGWGGTITPPGFFCQMSSENGPGMACQDNIYRQGFTVKRGTYWSYPAYG